MEDRGIRDLASVKKICSSVLPCYKEFAALMLFLDSYPLPPLTWEGVMLLKLLISA